MVSIQALSTADCCCTLNYLLFKLMLGNTALTKLLSSTWQFATNITIVSRGYVLRWWCKYWNQGLMACCVEIVRLQTCWLPLQEYSIDGSKMRPVWQECKYCNLYAAWPQYVHSLSLAVLLWTPLKGLGVSLVCSPPTP